MRGFFKRLFALVWVLMAISFPMSVYGGTSWQQAGNALVVIAMVVMPLQWVLSGVLNPMRLFQADDAKRDASE